MLCTECVIIPMDAADGLTTLEHSSVSPAPGGIGDHLFPLSFLDIPWICFYPIHQLCFYEYPHSQSYFLQTIVPKLKHSLSIALQHFFPYAGNLIVYPYDANSTTSKKPEIRYVDGDSVSLVVAESTKDFNYLTGNHARKANEFYPLIPQLGQIVKLSDFVKVPLLAVQVTVFPGHGFCIGLTTHHVACDGNARVRFLRAWASITKFGDDKVFLASGSLPFLDRSVLKDPKSLRELFWRQVMESGKQECQPPHLFGQTDKVRVTFVVTQTQINRLKELVFIQRQTLARVSSFVVVCAHVWTCMAKLHAAISEEKGENELEKLVMPADGRARLDPPIPVTYFGNCLIGAIVTVKRDELTCEEGFLNAVEIIWDTIRKRFSSQESIFEEAETWLTQGDVAKVLGVAGSPKFNIYDTNFGWGKPNKCEAVSIDYSGSVSINVSKESEEDLEIGLSLPKNEMDVFVTIFDNGLKNSKEF